MPPTLAWNEEPNMKTAGTVHSSHAKILADRLQARMATVGVVGFGHLSLPLATAFARVGFNVRGIDADARGADLFGGVESDIVEVATHRSAEGVKSETLRQSRQYVHLADCDAIVICMPAPLRKNRHPDLSYIVAAIDSIVPVARRGQCLVLESTTFPGTTRKVVLPRLEERGFEVGRDIFLAFSPERIDLGDPRFGFTKAPRVIGGCTPVCSSLAATLYGAISESIVEVSSLEAAEMARCLEITFLSVNIGLVNEVAPLCSRMKLEV